jgi:hypothetical protein
LTTEKPLVHVNKIQAAIDFGGVMTTSEVKGKNHEKASMRLKLFWPTATPGQARYVTVCHSAVFSD